VMRVFTCSLLRSVMAEERRDPPELDRRNSAGWATGSAACTIAAPRRSRASLIPHSILDITGSFAL
jgi:hypothetical protein